MNAVEARALAYKLYEGRVDRMGLPEIDHMRRVALCSDESCRM